MKLRRYLDQEPQWPRSGRHILAGFDDRSVVVYQAYRPSIGLQAVAHQHFGGEFSFSRMSWIKTNFLWMMYRSNWGTKEGQEITLAVTIPLNLFDEILATAVPSAFSPDRYSTEKEWKHALANSEVRLQWDPDHDPTGNPCARRAVQLGLRGEILRRYAMSEVIRIENISDFVARERQHANRPFDQLTTPEERVYLPTRADALRSAGLDLSVSRTATSPHS